MGAGILWFSLASALLPSVAITPWTAAAGLTLPAVLAARFLVGFGEGELGWDGEVACFLQPAQSLQPQDGSAAASSGAANSTCAHHRCHTWSLLADVPCCAALVSAGA
jgi:hypothetical protein